MESKERFAQSSESNSRRSFNRFLIVIITLMLVTGVLSIWDNWGGEVVEITGPNEQKMLELPHDVRIILNGSSKIRFQKGSTHKLVLNGSATITADAKKITVETLDVIANARAAQFKILTQDGETYVKAIRGKVDLTLKPAKEETITLLPGEEYHHSLAD